MPRFLALRSSPACSARGRYVIACSLPARTRVDLTQGYMLYMLVIIVTESFRARRSSTSTQSGSFVFPHDSYPFNRLLITFGRSFLLVVNSASYSDEDDENDDRNYNDYWVASFVLFSNEDEQLPSVHDSRPACSEGEGWSGRSRHSCTKLYFQLCFCGRLINK